MALPEPMPSRWSPVLVGTMIVRLIGAACFVMGLFWLIDWGVYRVEFAVDQDLAYAGASFRYLAVGGLLLIFEPMFVRWLLGGRLGSGSVPVSAPTKELPLEEE
ncbi:MAG: hypothetical protein ACFCBV_10020 [Phycisphaerales bacterium]